MPGTNDRPHRGPRRARRAVPALAVAVLLACLAAAGAGAAPIPTRVVHATGQIVPIPASVPHEAGDMVDRRIVPDLRWIAKRYPIFVTDGYSGPLPDGEHVGCDACHVRDSDHYNGLAVDIVPLGGSAECDASWARSPASPTGPSRPRTTPGRPSAGSATTATPATAAATTSTSPGNTRSRRCSSSPNGSRCSRPGRGKSRRNRSRSRRGRRAAAKPEAVPAPGGSRRGQAPPKGPQGGISTVQAGGVSPDRHV